MPQNRQNLASPERIALPQWGHFFRSSEPHCSQYVPSLALWAMPFLHRGQMLKYSFSAITNLLTGDFKGGI